MDDNKCGYGWYTTYQHNWFLKRKDSYNFYVSPMILHNALASSTQLSLRECFLFLGLKARNSVPYPIKIGKDLVRSLLCITYYSTNFITKLGNQTNRKYPPQNTYNTRLKRKRGSTQSSPASLKCSACLPLFNLSFMFLISLLWSFVFQFLFCIFLFSNFQLFILLFPLVTISL